MGGDGTLYIADAGNRRVRCVRTDGIITTIAGAGVQGYSGDYGPAAAAKLNFPYGAAVAPNGDIYVADYGTNCVRKISAVMPGVRAGDILVPSQDGQLIYQFDYAGRHRRTISALTLSNLFTFAYSTNGLLASITDGDNNITTIEYNEAGKPAAIVGPYSNRTTLALNGNGYLASVANPAGETTVLGYDTNGLLTSIQGPKGSDYTYTVSYNDMGRVARSAEPIGAGGYTTYQQMSMTNGFAVVYTTAMGRVRSAGVEDLTTGDRRRTQTNPDGSRRVVVNYTCGSETNTLPDGGIVSRQYAPDPRFAMQAPVLAQEIVRLPSGLASTNAFQRTAAMSNDSPLSLVALTNTTAINGRTNTSVYLTSGRMTTTTTPAGRQTQTTMDSQGRLISFQVTGIETVTNVYDGNGRLSSSSRGGGATARAETRHYNSAGEVDRITDALGRTNALVYDAAGRVLTNTLPGDQTVGYAYDAHGNMTSLAPPGRPAHTFAYTVADLRSEYTPPVVDGATNTTYYTYNADRQLTSIRRPDGLTISNTYDAAGHLNTVTVPNGIYTYFWQTNGLLGGITAPSGVTATNIYDGSLVTASRWLGTVTGQVSRTFDNDFRMASLSVNGANTVTYQYDADGLITNAGVCGLTRSAANGLLTGRTLSNVVESLGYNGFGEVTNITVLGNGTNLLVANYAFDKLGRLTNLSEQIQGTNRTFVYTYDTAGRLSQVATNGTGTNTYQYDSNGNCTNSIVAAVLRTASYDDRDRLLSNSTASYGYNAAGDLTNKMVNGSNTVYQYDVLGNLLSMTLPTGITNEYLVDSLNRRVGKKVNGVFTNGYLYADGVNPVVELGGNTNVISVFVYGSRAYVPDYMIKGGVSYRIVCDHLGSPRLIVQANTGEVMQRMDYDEFGRVVLDTSPGFQPFGFAGGLYDPATGLVRFGARDYDAEIGRWLTPDPVLFSKGDVNLYGYVNNDPVNRIDPDGYGPGGLPLQIDVQGEFFLIHDSGLVQAQTGGGNWHTIQDGHLFMSDSVQIRTDPSGSAYILMNDNTSIRISGGMNVTVRNQETTSQRLIRTGQNYWRQLPNRVWQFMRRDSNFQLHPGGGGTGARG